MFRCKYRVDSVTVENDGEARDVRMSACVDKDGDNVDWSRWTPSGSFQMWVTNTDAFPKIDALKYGDLFYIDLSPVED